LPLLLLLLQVNEMPGTYFYHDHSSLNRADGLQVRGMALQQCQPGMQPKPCKYKQAK
jgi:hypothetical protein